MGSTAGVKGLDLGDIGCNGDGDVLRDPDESADCGASVCGLGCVRKGGCKGNHAAHIHRVEIDGREGQSVQQTRERHGDEQNNDL